jgi:hypothetical protein
MLSTDTPSDVIDIIQQPPIQLQGLSGKYASALYSAAVKKDEKTLSTVEKDLSSIQRVLSSKDGPPLSFHQ